MIYLEVLVEGTSDVPVVREVLTRGFGLVEGEHFRIHPHKGRGDLPPNPLAKPEMANRTLLHQLPAKLRGFANYLGLDACVVVVIDVDDTPCRDLLSALNDMLAALPSRPPRVLFRLAIEETESWFLADPDAVRMAYPKARVHGLRQIEPDAIVGAWEALAQALGASANEVTGADKYRWAEAIAPHLNLDEPRSPSLRKLIDGLRREIQGAV